MPKANHKTKGGGDKLSSEKNSFNPPQPGGHVPDSQTPGPQALDRKNRDSQGAGQGDAHQIKY